MELLDSALQRAEDQEEILQQIIDAHLAQGFRMSMPSSHLGLCELDERFDDGTIYQLALCFDFMHHDRAIETFDRLI